MNMRLAELLRRPGLDPVTLVALGRVLSDVTRVRVLLALSAGERCVGELTDQLSIPQPTLSHHLGILRGLRAVRARRAGKQIFYSLRDADGGPTGP
jgi:DNA-binding transcriptional ArsR family regulator